MDYFDRELLNKDDVLKVGVLRSLEDIEKMGYKIDRFGSSFKFTHPCGRTLTFNKKDIHLFGSNELLSFRFRESKGEGSTNYRELWVVEKCRNTIWSDFIMFGDTHILEESLFEI